MFCESCFFQTVINILSYINLYLFQKFLVTVGNEWRVEICKSEKLMLPSFTVTKIFIEETEVSDYAFIHSA